MKPILLLTSTLSKTPLYYATRNYRAYKDGRVVTRGQKDDVTDQINAIINERAVKACVDMAERYDCDIEGCDADELLRYGEGIDCCFRLAYIIKYGEFPPKGDAWSVEFIELMRQMQKERQHNGFKENEKTNRENPPSH